MRHDVKHVVSVKELMDGLIGCSKERPGSMGFNDLKVRVCTGPSKDQTHLISGVYYSPESQSVWIDVEQ